MARRYDSEDAKLGGFCPPASGFFSGEGLYQHEGEREIRKEADVSAGSFQNIFHTKDGVLTELIGMMFSRQFGAVRPLASTRPLSRIHLCSGDGAAAGADRDEREPAGHLRGGVHLSRPRRSSSTEAQRQNCRQGAFGAYPARICRERLLRDGAGHGGHDARLYGEKVRPVLHAGSAKSGGF